MHWTHAFTGATSKLLVLVAIMRASLADHDASDDPVATASLTAFSSSLIRAMPFLEPAFFAVNVPIIRHRVAAEVDASRQGLFDRREQGF